METKTDKFEKKRLIEQKIKRSEIRLFISSFLIPVIIIIVIFLLSPINLFFAGLICLAIIIVHYLIIANFISNNLSYKSYFDVQSLIFGYNTKNRLVGMIKEQKKLEIQKTSQLLKINPQELLSLIYELIGDGKIEGKFSGNDVFEITSDLDEFIKVLDSKFEDWAKKQEKI